MGRRAAKAALCVALALLLPLVPSSSTASFENITSNASRTVVVPMYAHDAYDVTLAGGSVTIEFTANATVDFYVLTATGYAEYVDPNSSTFHYRDLSENAQSFSYTTTQSGLIFVIDNDDIAVGGASPTGPVSYTLAIQFTGSLGDGGLSIILAIIAAAAVGTAIAVVLILRRRRQRPSIPYPQTAAMPQMAGPLPAPAVPTTTVPFPPPTMPATPASIVGPAPGATRRSLNDAERAMLARDFNDQRMRMIVGSIVGLGFAAAYNVLPNLLTLGLTILAFIAPAMAYAISKLRRAIVAGQVIEYVGVPMVVGTTRIAKQEFYRLQFGTERVLVSSGLYGRLGPNQPTSLTVLQGARAAIAVNGVALAKMELVRFEPGLPGPTGWP